jgi:hypothetical protein
VCVCRVVVPGEIFFLVVLWFSCLVSVSFASHAVFLAGLSSARLVCVTRALIRAPS